MFLFKYGDPQLSPMFGLQNLKNKYFVKVSKNGNLVMHEQLHDMGRKIVAIEQKIDYGIQKKKAYNVCNIKRQPSQFPKMIEWFRHLFVAWYQFAQIFNLVYHKRLIQFIFSKKIMCNFIIILYY